MTASLLAPQRSADYELRFRSLFDNRNGYAFACDAHGHVDLASLSDRLRNNYLFARALVGRDFNLPSVEAGPGGDGSRQAH